MNTTIIHPAYSLRKVIDRSGMTQQEVALRLDMSEKHLSEILNEKKAITTETALKLEKIFWGNASFWINLQARYDEMTARKSIEESIQDQIPLLDTFKDCYADLIQLGYCKKTKDAIEKVSELLSFFNVTSLMNVRAAFQVAFRKSSKIAVSNESVAAWLRVWEIKATELSVDEFNADKLRASLTRIRNITQDGHTFLKNLFEIGNECGVKFVFVTHFKHAPVNGAARWIDGCPIVQLSDMGKKYDRVIFTLFHELWHILLHSNESFFDEKVGSEYAVEKELEADRFAQECVIPKEYNFSARLPELVQSEQKTVMFAKEVGVDVSVIVWRMQRELNDYTIFHRLLTKVEIQ